MKGIINRIPLSRRIVYQTIFILGVINGLVFLINGLAYLPSSSGPLPVELFRYTAFVSHFLLTAILLVLILYLFYFLFRSAALIKILSVLVFSFAQVFIFVDVRVFAHFKFHLSGIVFEAMTTPGYWDSMHFSAVDKIFSAAAAAGLLLLEFGLFTLIRRKLSRGKFLPRLARPRVCLILAGLVVILALAEKISFGVADLYGYSQITRYQKIFPLYRPMTFGRLLGGYIDEENKADLPLPAGSELNYPLPEFQYERLDRPYNVVLILVESMRFDMLNDEVMPNLNRFGRRSVVALNHYSSGNTSRFGGFGAIYGLYGTYWHRILNNRRGPVMIKQLIENDYSFKVMSSTELTYPEFRDTCFVDVEEEPEDNLPGEDSSERDEVLADRFISWLGAAQKKEPFFAFLFLDSPHSTFYFKEGFEKFKPCAEELSFIDTDLEEDREEIFNRFRNAVHYADYSLGRILTALEDGGYLENTVVVITGDHGQEFWEAGNYGHNNAYTDYQTRVPLVISAPGLETPRLITHLTNHVDLPPTILGLLGDKNDPASYSLGKDIFGNERTTYMVLSGWDDCCLVTPRTKMRFSTEAYNIFDSEITDNNDRTGVKESVVEEEKDKYLLPALEGMGRFLK